MQQNGRPLGLRSRVSPTQYRSDAHREFLIRLSHEARKRLDVRIGDRITVEFRGGPVADATEPGLIPAWLPGTDKKHYFRVLAAVRNLKDPALERTERFEGDDPGRWLAHVRMDMTLRDAIGVETGEDVFLFPTDDTIRVPPVARMLDFQYVVCRVHFAFPGSMETPNCIARPSTIEALGLDRRGIVFIESPCGHHVEASLVPIDEDQRTLARENEQALRLAAETPEREIHPGANYDLYLDELKRRRHRPAGHRDLPPIFMDASIRRRLHVQAGQAVWVRRATGPLYVERLMDVMTPLTLAIVGAILTIPDKLVHPDSSTRWIVVAILTSLIFFGGLAWWEVRASIRAPRGESAPGLDSD